jgi:hypothetical protein
LRQPCGVAARRDTAQHRAREAPHKRGFSVFTVWSGVTHHSTAVPVAGVALRRPLWKSFPCLRSSRARETRVRGIRAHHPNDPPDLAHRRAAPSMLAIPSVPVEVDQMIPRFSPEPLLHLPELRDGRVGATHGPGVERLENVARRRHRRLEAVDLAGLATGLDSSHELPISRWKQSTYDAVFRWLFGMSQTSN